MKRQEKFSQMIQVSTSTKERMFLSAIYLFSAKGFANVGIRELCRSVNVKESSFYNHFASKDDLLAEIFERFMEISTREVFSKEEVDTIINNGNIEVYLKESMKEFFVCLNDPLYFSILQIINMESYTNPKAYNMVKNNDYILHTEMILNKMIDKGFLKKLDAKAVSISFYFCLKGLMHDYMLKDVWNEDTQELLDMIQKHVQLYLNLLKLED
jgi:TetR/AcrR family transcriptional regulator, biofilm operon repressor